MSDFQSEVIERLARIEEKTNSYSDVVRQTNENTSDIYILKDRYKTIERKYVYLAGIVATVIAEIIVQVTTKFI